MRSGARKLTTEEVAAIRASHRRQKHLAAEYGVSASTISRIVTNKTWAVEVEQEDYDEDDECEQF